MKKDELLSATYFRLKLNSGISKQVWPKYKWQVYSYLKLGLLCISSRYVQLPSIEPCFCARASYKKDQSLLLSLFVQGGLVSAPSYSLLQAACFQPKGYIQN